MSFKDYYQKNKKIINICLISGLVLIILGILIILDRNSFKQDKELKLQQPTSRYEIRTDNIRDDEYNTEMIKQTISTYNNKNLLIKKEIIENSFDIEKNKNKETKKFNNRDTILKNYEYNKNDLRIQKDKVVYGGNKKIISYSYNNSNKLKSKKIFFQNEPDKPTEITDYEYDILNRLSNISKTTFSGDFKITNKTTFKYKDDTNKKIKIIFNNDNNYIDYVYDQTGNLIEKNFFTKNSQEESEKLTQKIKYDYVDNKLDSKEKTENFGKTNQTINKTFIHYDQENNIIRKDYQNNPENINYSIFTRLGQKLK
ncbi:hypothetical protein ['Camptotheca acuminata' phytoplasma]|uniref:hypothetical protein n=1 Tax='Camptotheca acuminata' phytoplasma TaxID=3239192 RepID=UPI00351A9768